MSARIQIMVLMLACLVFARDVRADDCSRWLPDLDPDCRRVARPEGFVAPVASPFLLESPFIATGLQGYYLRQSVPNDSVLSGGKIEVAAGKFQIAITDRVGIVGARLGAMWIQPGGPAIPKQKTWLPLMLGVKVGVYQDRISERFVAAVLRYADGFEICSDRSLLPSVVGGMRAGNFTLQGGLGGSAALGSASSSSVFWHAQAGFARWRHITPFVQFSGQHWVGRGNGSLSVALSAAGRSQLGTNSISVRQAEQVFGPFEGGDLFNLGSHHISGRSLVTGSLGLEVRFGPVSISSAYDIPVLAQEGLFKNRLTASVSLEF